MKPFPELPENLKLLEAGVAPLDFEYFQKQVYEGAGKYLKEVNDQVLDRIGMELEIIRNKNLLSYFSFWMDLINFCKENSIITGPGRGPVNCSLVATCLGFTRVNPLDWGFSAARFLNAISPLIPSFTIDVPLSAREELIDYLKETYGKSYVAALSGRPDEDQVSARLFAPVGSGLVISAKPLLPNVPTMKLYDSKEIIVDFPVKHLQNLGCIKFDIHGLKSLDIIQRISLMYSGPVYPSDWNDTEVIEYLMSNSGKDIFPFHSEGIRQLMADISPENLEELALVYTLHRPGLIEYVGDMLQFKASGDDAYFVHESLYGPLHSTYGYIVYKEQFIEIITSMSGMNEDEADEMCRVLLEDEQTENFTQKFQSNCIEKGIDEEIVVQVMSELIASHPFLFSKAHAIGAAMIGYSVAWHQMNGRM